jgi:hypothetical protein
MNLKKLPPLVLLLSTMQTSWGMKRNFSENTTNMDVDCVEEHSGFEFPSITFKNKDLMYSGKNSPETFAINIRQELDVACNIIQDPEKLTLLKTRYKTDLFPKAIRSVLDNNNLSLLKFVDDWNNTILHYIAKSYPHRFTFDFMTILLHAAHNEDELQALLKAQNNMQQTPLHIAAEHLWLHPECADIMKGLLSYAGVKNALKLLETKDYSGRTPYDVAVKRCSKAAPLLKDLEDALRTNDMARFYELVMIDEK